MSKENAADSVLALHYLSQIWQKESQIRALVPLMNLKKDLKLAFLPFPESFSIHCIYQKEIKRDLT